MFDEPFRVSATPAMCLRQADHVLSPPRRLNDLSAIAEAAYRQCCSYGLRIEPGVIRLALRAHIEDMATIHGVTRQTALERLSPDFPNVLARSLTGALRS